MRSLPPLQWGLRLLGVDLGGKDSYKLNCSDSPAFPLQFLVQLLAHCQPAAIAS
jgi:hypothetical protein